MTKPAPYALSIKQPWATLLVHGRKTIEVRRWQTSRLGLVLIHAARVPDERPQGWALLPDDLQQEAKRAGGIIGQAELTACVTYRTAETFQADQAKHLNDPSWFELPQLYGFVFAKAEPLPFRPFPGWLRFFPVDEERLPAGKKSKVRDGQQVLFDE